MLRRSVFTMMDPWQILFMVAAAILCYGLIHILQFLHDEWTYPLVAGPRNSSWIFGNFKEIEAETDVTKRWQEEFGPMYLFRGLFSRRRLYAADVKALSYMVANDSRYVRVPSTVSLRTRLMGNGVLTVIGDDHKRQRRILNQAFGAPQIRFLTEIFVEKAAQLRDVWATEVAKRNSVDVTDGLRRMTLDVIGQAGFNYDFHALVDTSRPEKMTEALTNLLHSPDTKRNFMFAELQLLIPALKFLVNQQIVLKGYSLIVASKPLPGRKAMATAHAAMHSIASQIASDSKRDILAQAEKSFDSSKRDLLSVLLKSNMSTSISAHQRMSDAELIAQIPTFVVAGHETTSNSTSWALHSLSLHPVTQKKLRKELFTLSSENPTTEELNSLPYLECVIRETLRVHGPVGYLDRIATQDDVLPLSRPYIDRAGKSHDTFPIRKGQIIQMSILAFNHDPEIWGPDAGEFRPERWENVPSAAGAIPSMPHPNLFSFFAGQTNCIGYRFALVEMKALLFTLIRAFEFEPAVPSKSIGYGGNLVRAPVHLDEPERGSCLPMILKPVPLNTQDY
ncbi:cytochrome P450 [Mycena sanguinolenta]|nr:cytochrome P450 [Mycena sanguinolenta]